MERRSSEESEDSLKVVVIFFFNDTATTEIYTLSLHDALPILKVSPPSVPTDPQGLAAPVATM